MIGDIEFYENKRIYFFDLDELYGEENCDVNYVEEFNVF